MGQYSYVLKLLLGAVLVCSTVAQLSKFGWPRVEIADGKLRGKYVLTRESKRVRAFLGIPYAKPPVGELRFKNPEPATAWEGERWAVDHPKKCVQPDKRHGAATGQEDCLYLNVYAPEGVAKPQNHNQHTKITYPRYKSSENEIKSNAIPGSKRASAANATKVNMTTATTCPLVPVMVFLHGGGFETGHSEPFTHEYLMEQGVVVVTVHYRLGLLGFLSTGDEELPGNLGFKDQRLALKWVQENIEHFGGCPEKVTIFGDGAGGASVHYHLLFPPINNVTFRAGISMSGTALSPWAFRPPSEVSQMVDMLAGISGCPRESREFVECLRERPAEEFVEMLHKYKEELLGGCGEWVHAVPVLGGVLEPLGLDAFITANPWSLKLTTPWMAGFTSKEMLYEFTPELVDRRDILFAELEKNFDRCLSQVLGYEFSQVNDTGLTEKMRTFYYKDEPISREHFGDVIDAVSDGLVVYPAFEAVKRAGRRSTWLYYFDYTGSNTYGPSALDGRIGPGRGDDLFYFFPRPLGKSVPRRTKQQDTEMSKKFVKLWTSFATNLDPTPTPLDDLKWSPTAPSTTFLNIGQKSLTVERPFQWYRMNFWSSQNFPHRDDYYADSSNSIESLEDASREGTRP